MKKLLFLLSTTSLVFTITANAQQYWYDTMGTYALGNITTNSSNLWINHSGSGKDSLIVNYAGSPTALAGTRHEVNQNRTDDVHRWFDPVATNGVGPLNGVVYASFTVSVTNMPDNPNGTYFAHFMNTGTFFRGRIFTVVPSNPYPFTNSIPGTIRFGVANGAADGAVGSSGVTGGPTNFVPVDLALNTDYQVVVKVDASAFTATIWVNPASESDTAVNSGLANDFAPYTNSLNAFSFRQSVGEGILEIRDVSVGLTFADVMTNTPVTPVIGLQPASVSNFSGNPALVGVAASGQSLSFQWYQVSGGVTNTVGGNSQDLVFQSLAASDDADYFVVITNTGGSVTSQVAHVSVNATPTPPSFTTAPHNTTNFVGDTATLSGTATGTGPLSYQWQHYGTNVINGASTLPGDVSFTSGAQAPTLTIVNVSTNQDGAYALVVTGGASPPASGPATLTILPPRSVSISFLRSLVDTNWQTTDTTTLYSITGQITVFTNLSSGQSSYYIQDSSGGLNLFVGGTTTFRPLIGDIVSAAGTLSTFSGNLELISSPSVAYRTHTVIGHSSVLPTPFVFAPILTNNIGLMETNLEGKVAILTNVFFTNAVGAVTGNGQTTITVTNGQGMPFLVFFPGGQDQDVRARAYPGFAWTLTGVLNQFSSLVSPTNKVGYELLVSRWQDVQTNPPPAVTVTQTLSGNNVILTWTAAAPFSDSSFGAYSYSVYVASDVNGPYAPLATGLTFNSTAGIYIDGGTNVYYAAMNGTNEAPVPVLAPGAYGRGLVVVTPDQSSIFVNESWCGLTANATASHIHGPASTTTAAGVLFPFSGVPSTTCGAIPQQTIAINATQLGYLRTGQLYMNVHTGTNPGGEVRGQLYPAATKFYKVTSP